MQEFENGLDEKWDYDEVPVNSEVKIEELKKFLKPSDTLIFYGGEPLLKIEKIKEIIDNVDCRFCMQTNGKLLDKLPTEYLLKLDKMLVSIDGTKERTDFNKGAGTYDLVVKNLKDVRERGFKGEIVARMTVSGFPDVNEQARHLLSLGFFDSIHWQIDAGFYKNDFDYEIFKEFAFKCNKSVSKLIDFWLEEMRKGNVLKIYPFLGIFESLYHGKKTKLRCGSGHANFTITTSGKLSACPIMNSVKDFYCGDITTGLKKEISVGEPCLSCTAYGICGGRCLYSNQAKLWPKEGEKLVCETVKHLIKEIERVLPSTKELLEKDVIKKEDFEYEKYFGPEIIP